MNTQFKRLLVGVSSIFSLFVSAEDCGVVYIQNGPNSDKIIEIAAVDGTPFRLGSYDETKILKIANGSYPFKLSDGNHSLILREWDRDFYINLNVNITRRFAHIKKKSTISDARLLRAYIENRHGDIHSNSARYKRNQQLLASVINDKPIEVTITKNGSYHLSILSNDGDSQYVMSYQGQQACAKDGSKLPTNAGYFTQITQPLPSDLETRLDDFMYSLNKYHKSANLPTRNIVPIGFYQYFGAALSNTTKNTGYQVLSVQPFSLASRMGLVSGDYILSFGGDEVKNNSEKPNAVLLKYLASIGNKEGVELTILREDQQLELSHPFVTPIIPQTSYSMATTDNTLSESQLSQPVKLPPELLFEYDLLMLEISNRFKDKLQTNNIEIIRPASLSKKYGLHGIVTKSGEANGLRITLVDDESNAQRIGIKTDDIIQTINGKGITDDNKPFYHVLSQLKQHEKVTVEVIRNGTKQILSGQYNEKHIPAYSLKMMSVSQMYALNKKLAKPRKFPHFKKRRTFNPLYSETEYQRDLDSRSRSTFRNGPGPRGKNNTKSN